MVHTGAGRVSRGGGGVAKYIFSGPKCPPSYHWGKEDYMHYKNCWEFNLCNAMQYITS